MKKTSLVERTCVEILPQRNWILLGDTKARLYFYDIRKSNEPFYIKKSEKKIEGSEVGYLMDIHSNGLGMLGCIFTGGFKLIDLNSMDFDVINSAAYPGTCIRTDLNQILISSSSQTTLFNF